MDRDYHTHRWTSLQSPCISQGSTEAVSLSPLRALVQSLSLSLKDITEMPTSPLPASNSLDQIYSSNALLAQGKRWDSLAQQFEKEFGVKPQKVARAPGRVNVIGELPGLFPESCEKLPARNER